MKVIIHANNNGYGLSKDIEVLRSVLDGHDLTIVAASREAKGRFDVAFHVEHLQTRNFDSAKVNVAIPNPEWLSRGMVHNLRRCDFAIAKTQDTADILREQYPEVTTYFTGWTSPDPGIRSSERGICHLAGMSPLKSTHAVVQALADLRLPALVHSGRIPSIRPPNIHFVKQRSPSPPYHLNIQVLPSQYEGFGHAINESLACGCTVITTDAPPMNTFGSTYLVKTTGHHRQNAARIWHLDPTDLRRKIIEAHENAPIFDPKARDGYLERDRAFRTAFKTLPIWTSA